MVYSMTLPRTTRAVALRATAEDYSRLLRLKRLIGANSLTETIRRSLRIAEAHITPELVEQSK